MSLQRAAGPRRCSPRWAMAMAMAIVMDVPVSLRRAAGPRRCSPRWAAR